MQPGRSVKDLFHRIGVVEVRVSEHTKVSDDHEGRLRKLEHLTAKVVGGAIVGSALGGWILSNLGSCVG
jgi:hypothetical protein